MPFNIKKQILFLHILITVVTTKFIYLFNVRRKKRRKELIKWKRSENHNYCWMQNSMKLRQYKSTKKLLDINLWYFNLKANKKIKYYL